MEQTTGKLPVTFPLTIQDITPYGNGLYHFNSILQPATATRAPVVGIAITSETLSVISTTSSFFVVLILKSILTSLQGRTLLIIVDYQMVDGKYSHDL